MEKAALFYKLGSQIWLRSNSILKSWNFRSMTGRGGRHTLTPPPSPPLWKEFFIILVQDLLLNKGKTTELKISKAKKIRKRYKRNFFRKIYYSTYYQHSNTGRSRRCKWVPPSLQFVSYDLPCNDLWLQNVIIMIWESLEVTNT